MNIRWIVVFAFVCHALAFVPGARAQVYEEVFDFGAARDAASVTKGDDPNAELIQARDGNFYGTTSGSGNGTVFKMTPAGVATTLVEFTGNDGQNRGRSPKALIESRDGNLYGTTTGGGKQNRGTLFRMTFSGELTTLADFEINNATSPNGLVEGRDGNFYGTSYSGGANELGAVFRVTPSGTISVLASFAGTGGPTRGSHPRAILIQGNDGNFYGTTEEGGANDLGTIFKITASGALTTLVEFTGQGSSNRGSNPQAALLEGSDGNFYGTTSNGGMSNRGTIFKMTPAGVLTTLVDFTYNGVTNRGAAPDCALVEGRDGNFYGTASAPYPSSGTLFSMTPEGVLTTLQEFTYADGGFLHRGLVEGSDGNFYGTAGAGYTNVYLHGAIFRLTPTGTLTTLVRFTGKGNDMGTNPSAPLVQGSDGNFYGTTEYGGLSDVPLGLGTVFKMTTAGELSTLVAFTTHSPSSPGVFPRGGLVEGSDGSFYGTTSFSTTGEGTVFKITPAGVLTTLVEFTGNEAINKGAMPTGSLVVAGDGSFYGTTRDGGANDLGTIFKMTSAGVLTTLVEFSGNGAANRGSNPNSLMLASDGNFYGTTETGGASDLGTVFRMSSAGILTTLVEFTGDGAPKRGRNPQGGLIQGTDGNFYGTTSRTDASLDAGTVFRMTSSGTLTTLVDFSTLVVPNGIAGRNPQGTLVQGSDGNFYGTTEFGGAGNGGTVFKMTPAGALTVLNEFGSGSNSYPMAGLIAAADGNLYGTTASFGSSGFGSIFRLVFPGAPTFGISRVAMQGSGTAVVESQVNPRGASTSVSLEYGTDGSTYPNSIPVKTGLQGFQSKLVGATLSNLAPATLYFYRFRATSSAGTTVSPATSFSTLADPVASVLPASEITATSATFNGTVNARSFDTTVVFEWGTDGFAFPNIVPALPGTVTGNTPVAVRASVAVVQGSAIYFRIRATNQGGTVTTGARGFNTGLGVTTSALGDSDVGVTDVTFRATVNTFGQTVSVKFKYWADSAPGIIFETATQTVTSSGPKEVTAMVSGLQENLAYSYRVSVELAGTETEGGAVAFTTETNAVPVAANDLVFYSGQVVVDPLANDTDPNEGTNANLMLDPVLVVPPNASLGVASVTSDRRFISYNPQFNVRDDDSLTYRVVDPLGANAQAQVRLIAFSKRAGLYGGRIVFGSGTTAREGQVAVQMGGGGAISTSFLNWPNATEHLGESFVLKGVFDQRGRFNRTLNSPSGAVLTLSVQLDADAPQMHGIFEERVNGISTTGPIAFTLTLNAGTGGLAGSGLRTGFLSPPPELASAMADGYVRMTVGKDARRGARFAGRLPDGEPFLASAKAQGRTYELTRKLEQGGLFTGLVRALDGSSGASGMIGDLYWQKHASSRAKFYRGGVETMLSLSGAAYPSLAKNALPPIGLGAASPNARLRVSGGDLAGPYRDLLLNILPGGAVQVLGSDPMQSGADIPTNKLRIKVDASRAAFGGGFLHPATGKVVTFEGAFRVPFDEEPGQGRGVFRGPGTAGAVQVLIP